MFKLCSNCGQNRVLVVCAVRGMGDHVCFPWFKSCYQDEFLNMFMSPICVSWEKSISLFILTLLELGGGYLLHKGSWGGGYPSTLG